MNLSLSAQQLTHFREHGTISFTPFPLDFSTLAQAIDEALQKGGKRDLWRRSPYLNKLILRTLAPLVLELVKKKGIRIGCDEWFAPLPEWTGKERMQDLFSFRELAAIAVLQCAEKQVTIFHPSSLASLIPPSSYAVVYAQEKAQFIDNPRDPGAPLLKKMGYAYGDFLQSEAHPLIYSK